jgi:hypothetical protein
VAIADGVGRSGDGACAVRAKGNRPRPLLMDTLQAIEGLDLKIEFRAEPHDPRADWVGAASLASPDHAHLGSMLARFKATGYAPNPRAAAALMMLRFGWVGGFAIAPYLTHGRVPILHDYGLYFPPSPGPGPRVLWIRDARFVGRPADPFAGTPEWIESAPEDVLRQRLLESLLAFTEPLVAALHAWSQRSRHALWAMATATWASQFQNVARALGDEERGVREARAMFMLAPEIKRAAPAFHEVRSGDATTYRQLWNSCCLYFKVTERDFCSSCPIIPANERIQKQRASLARQRP